jgi:hypothetical protein
VGGTLRGSRLFGLSPSLGVLFGELHLQHVSAIRIEMKPLKRREDFGLRFEGSINVQAAEAGACEYCDVTLGGHSSLV